MGVYSKQGDVISKLEQEICARSSIFIGTSSSSWTQTVTHQRENLRMSNMNDAMLDHLIDDLYHNCANLRYCEEVRYRMARRLRCTHKAIFKMQTMPKSIAIIEKKSKLKTTARATFPGQVAAPLPDNNRERVICTRELAPPNTKKCQQRHKEEAPLFSTSPPFFPNGLQLAPYYSVLNCTLAFLLATLSGVTFALRFLTSTEDKVYLQIDSEASTTATPECYHRCPQHSQIPPLPSSTRCAAAGNPV
eukprot:5237245-Pyramimonas_sp.AAC.1